MYALEHKSEAERLENQALQKDYSLKEELKYLLFEKGNQVLDAGCGSGLLCKYLAQEYADKNLSITGFDFSDIRVQQAKESLKLAGLKNVKVDQNNLESIQGPDNEYDVIISRFVIEHLGAPMKALTELKRILKPGGMIYLIDLDGIWVNIHTKNQKLNLMISKVEKELNVDFTVGRKLGVMISQLGFKNIAWNVTTHSFNGAELMKEHENNKTRCEILWPKLVSIFKTESEASYFVDNFLSEMLCPETAVFHNKFIVRGIK